MASRALNVLHWRMRIDSEGACGLWRSTTIIIAHLLDPTIENFCLWVGQWETARGGGGYKYEERSQIDEMHHVTLVDDGLERK